MNLDCFNDVVGFSQACASSMLPFLSVAIVRRGVQICHELVGKGIDETANMVANELTGD
jgi:hypothetical protein